MLSWKLLHDPVFSNNNFNHISHLIWQCYDHHAVRCRFNPNGSKNPACSLCTSTFIPMLYTLSIAILRRIDNFCIETYVHAIYTAAMLTSYTTTWNLQACSLSTLLCWHMYKPVNMSICPICCIGYVCRGACVHLSPSTLHRISVNWHTDNWHMYILHICIYGTYLETYWQHRLSDHSDVLTYMLRILTFMTTFCRTTEITWVTIVTLDRKCDWS